MSHTTIISTWIDEPLLVEGLAVIQGTLHLYSFRIGGDFLGCYAASEPLDRLPVFQL